MTESTSNQILKEIAQTQKDMAEAQGKQCESIEKLTNLSYKQICAYESLTDALEKLSSVLVEVHKVMSGRVDSPTQTASEDSRSQVGGVSENQNLDVGVIVRPNSRSKVRENFNKQVRIHREANPASSVATINEMEYVSMKVS